MDNKTKENASSWGYEWIVVLEKGFESFPLQTVQHFLSELRSEYDHSLQQVNSTIINKRKLLLQKQK